MGFKTRLTGLVGLVLFSFSGCSGNGETELTKPSEPAVIYARDIMVRTEHGTTNPKQLQKIESFYEIEVTYEENGNIKKQKMKFPVVPYDKPQTLSQENPQESYANSVSILEEVKRIRADNIQSLQHQNIETRNFLEEFKRDFYNSPQIR